MVINNNNNSITGTGYCNTINYKAEDINTSDLVSTTNYLEGTKTTVTLSKNENCEIYNWVSIYIHTNNTTTAPITSVKALKYKLFQKGSLLTEGAIDKTGDLLLATVHLTNTDIDYDIYIYIDAEVSLGTFNNTTYSGYIYAETSQTSTVTDKDKTTIIYDYNYLLNDVFDEYYKISNFEPCCGSGSITSNNTYYDDVGKIFSVTSTNQGWYFSGLKNLTSGKQYTYSFEAKASTTVPLTVGSEQKGTTKYNIDTSWQRYTYTFVAQDNSGYKAFIFYYWYGADERTLQIRNLQIQEGNINNISISKESGIKIGTLASATRKEYEFLGWYTDPINGTKITENTIAPDTSTTYYAHWKYLSN